MVHRRGFIWIHLVKIALLRDGRRMTLSFVAQ
jgi:hypothetical protein